jgi:ribosomal protein S18 acetylase RimI-like enzyme
MEDFSIRPARLEDVGHLQQLNLQAFQHEHEHGFDRNLDMQWPLSEAAGAVWRGLVEQEGGGLWVAVMGTEIVGYLAGELSEAGRQRSGGVTALLRGLFVAQHARRRGIGEQLVLRFLAWAKAGRVAGISVAVAPANEPALALYRKLGFREGTLILVADAWPAGGGEPGSTTA